LINRDFGGEFGPPEADEVKKCAKTYVKKRKIYKKLHERHLAGAKMNADIGVIEECNIGWFEDKID
jgi:hypothetical protein